MNTPKQIDLKRYISPDVMEKHIGRVDFEDSLSTTNRIVSCLVAESIRNNKLGEILDSLAQSGLTLMTLTFLAIVDRDSLKESTQSIDFLRTNIREGLSSLDYLLSKIDGYKIQPES